MNQRWNKPLAAAVALVGAMTAWSLPEDDIEVKVDTPADA